MAVILDRFYQLSAIDHQLFFASSAHNYAETAMARQAHPAK
jgi:hypothetical protein